MKIKVKFKKENKMTAMVVGREINLSTVSRMLEDCGFNEIRCRTCASFADPRRLAWVPRGIKGMDGVDVVVVVKDGMEDDALSGIHKKTVKAGIPVFFW